MAKRADIGSKRLISLAPDAWAQWVMQRPDVVAQVILTSEFQWISRESDVLVKAYTPQEGEFLLLNELQLRYTNRMPRRMRAYAALAEERYDLPVYPVLVNLLPPPATVTIAPGYESHFMGLRAVQDYRLINLWEVEAELAFQPRLLSLLPFVPIMKGGGDAQVIRQAVGLLRADEQISELEPLLAFFASFVLDSRLVQQILRWDMVILEESAWYQEILQKGRQEGRQEEAAELILRLLSRQLSTIAPALQEQVGGLSVEQLEALGEALLAFSSEADLVVWLDAVAAQ